MAVALGRTVSFVLKCGGSGTASLRRGGSYQCSGCRVQTSPIAGTIFLSSRTKA